MSALTRAELLELPATVDLVTAAQALGIGRTTAYQLARAGDLPLPVLRLGARYRVPTAALLQVLGISPDRKAGEAG
jgi:excisionase family DNA binding protein